MERAPARQVDGARHLAFAGAAKRTRVGSGTGAAAISLSVHHLLLEMQKQVQNLRGTETSRADTASSAMISERLSDRSACKAEPLGLTARQFGRQPVYHLRRHSDFSERSAASAWRCFTGVASSPWSYYALTISRLGNFVRSSRPLSVTTNDCVIVTPVSPSQRPGII